MRPKTESRSIFQDFQDASGGEASEILRAKVDLLDRQLREAISQRDRLTIETSVLKQQVGALRPEIRRMRGELLEAQLEIERLNAIANPKPVADLATPDAILAFINERHNPSVRRIASRLGLSEEEARSTLGELQQSDLVSPLNLANGVQRWLLTKKGFQYIENLDLPKRAFRQRAPSRIYW